MGHSKVPAEQTVEPLGLRTLPRHIDDAVVGRINDDSTFGYQDPVGNGRRNTRKIENRADFRRRLVETLEQRDDEIRIGVHHPKLDHGSFRCGLSVARQHNPQGSQRANQSLHVLTTAQVLVQLRRAPPGTRQLPR